MSRLDPRLLTPPQEEEEIHPYRRPWRSVVIENSILLVLTGILFVLVSFLGFRLPDRVNTLAILLLALLPAVLWLIFSWRAEQHVPEPRTRLLAVAVVSALAANAVGIPLVNDLLQVDRWLPLARAVDRIIGYTFTVGIVQEMLKYLILRFIIWPDGFRTRLDGVAYGAASAVGYTTVLNLHFALSGSPLPDIASARFFETVSLHTITGILVGYGLAEVRFSQPNPFFLSIVIALASVIAGAAIPLRAGLVNSTLSAGVSAPRTFFGIAFAAVLFITFSFILAFLFDSAERREREAVLKE